MPTKPRNDKNVQHTVNNIGIFGPLHKFEDETDKTGNDPSVLTSRLLISIFDVVPVLLQGLMLIPLAIYRVIYNLFKSPKSLKGKICLITGTGRGIGRELGLQLAKKGAVIVCVDIREESNNETVRMIKDSGGAAHGYTCNIAKYEEVKQLAETVQKEVGRVYLLINNAALIMPHKTGEWPPEDVICTFNVNLFSHYWTINTFLPAMKEVNEGHIVNIISSSAWIPFPGLSIYGVSKAAASRLLEYVRLDLCNDANNKIVITGVYPSVVNSSADIERIYPTGRLNMMSLDHTVSLIVEGILYDKEMIDVPKFMYYITLLIRCLPEMFLMKLMELLKVKINVLNNTTKNDMVFGQIKEKCL